MEALKSNVAANIADLRRRNGMTQLELAERLKYSDKAVSKWERGESVPDVAVLKAIADLFGVSVDYLLEGTHKKEALPAPLLKSRTKRRGVITWLAVLLVWMVATVLFVILSLVPPVAERGSIWLAFVFAVPASLIVWLVMNTIWFNRRRNYPIVSLLMWSILAITHLTLLINGMNIWLIYILGIPAQVIICLWSGMVVSVGQTPNETK